MVFKFSILLYTGNLPVLVPSIDHQLTILHWDSRRLNFGNTRGSPGSGVNSASEKPEGPELLRPNLGHEVFESGFESPDSTSDVRFTKELSSLEIVSRYPGRTSAGRMVATHRESHAMLC